MIELLKQQFQASMDREEKIARVREFLQVLCLKILHDKGCFAQMAFVGGTALRMLHDLRRFSEDLDFSVVQRKGYDFEKTVSSVVRELKLYGLDVDAKGRAEKTVQSALLKFSRLLGALDLSPLKEQKLSIRIEVDSNPPAGWKTQTTLLNKAYLFPVFHFDLPSLYATKLHACFYRRFVKGRDFYDLLWYLGKKTKPNFTLLNNAIRQTEGHSPKVSEENLRAFLSEKLRDVDFDLVRQDVGRFLEDKRELSLLTYPSLKRFAEMG